MRRRFRVLFQFLFPILLIGCASKPPLTAQPATPTPVPATPNPDSLTVFISDLHFGLGKRSNGQWHPLDDFRWSNALRGFLDEISRRSGNRTTLVIAGDFFEMWQHPTVLCNSGTADLGCTIAEMDEVARLIIEGHRVDLETLGAFASRGENRLVVIPGNHDAALLLPTVWQRVANAFRATPGRVERVTTGVWISPDGRVVAEHGHQMPGEDVNGYKDWPRVTGRRQGRDFMLRPWGEQFVHRLYNEVEDRYSLIDNLIPQSKGIGHYLEERGTWGSTADIARLIAFNLTQTSIKQLTDLGPSRGEPPTWSIAGSRALGWKLFARAMPPDEWYRSQLETATGPEWQRIREQLDTLARDAGQLPDDEVKNLCDKGAAVATSDANLCPRPGPTLGRAILHSLVPGSRLRAMQKHLRTRRGQTARMTVFIYGHTHTLECPSVVTQGSREVTVANTGAFQRLADDERFRAKARERNLSPTQALGALTVEDLPACYSAVLLTYPEGEPKVTVQSWHMPEDQERGEFVSPTDCRCAKLGSSCEPRPNCN